jgi:hypothetical protein
MTQLPEGPVFAVDGEVFQWQDVFAHARASGGWADLERAARAGVASGLHADASPEEEERLEALVDKAGDEFRYERDLLTADEMEAWLAERGLTARTWLESVRRRILRELWADQLDELVARYQPASDDVDAALAADMVCGDTHGTLAESLAAVAAAAAAAGGAAPGEDRHQALREAAERFRAAALTAEALRREIASHQMEWVRIDCRALEFSEPTEAREAALCLREDGLPLEEVAQSAHVPVGALSFYLDEIDGEERSRFLASHAGNVVGPIPVDEVHILYHVDAKVMPSADDPAVLARARRLITARAETLEVQQRVQWLADHARMQ